MLTFLSPQTQQALAAPTVFTTSLVLHIQGPLFTRIDLDQVQPDLTRFIEQLELDKPPGEESEWIMMATLAIGSLLESGKPDGMLRRRCGLETTIPGGLLIPIRITLRPQQSLQSCNGLFRTTTSHCLMVCVLSLTAGHPFLTHFPSTPRPLLPPQPTVWV